MAIGYDIRSIDEFSEYLGASYKDPYVAVFNSDETSKPFIGNLKIYNIYGCVLRRDEPNLPTYGRQKCDPNVATLIFFHPYVDLNRSSEEEESRMDGWLMAFDLALFRRTTLADVHYQYNFLNYDTSEALHLTDTELAVILKDLQQLKALITGCMRGERRIPVLQAMRQFLEHVKSFYRRQLETRQAYHNALYNHFWDTVKALYRDACLTPQSEMIYFDMWRKIGVSRAYLDDLLMSRTGYPAEMAICHFIAHRAIRLMTSRKVPLYTIAQGVGFASTAGFSLYFKQATGMSLSAYIDYLMPPKRRVTQAVSEEPAEPKPTRTRRTKSRRSTTTRRRSSRRRRRR